MVQVFHSANRLSSRDDFPDPDFETVLRAQLGGTDHRLAEINGELARIGTRDPSAVGLLIEAGRCYLRKHDYLTYQRYATEAYECATAWGDPVAMAEAGLSLAVACCWTGDLRAAWSQAERVASYVDNLEDAAVGCL